MQTFLPYSDFSKCAEVLDDKRLYKQIVECKQILQTLKKIQGKESALQENKIIKIPWEHHPAVLMWKNHEELLRCYQWVMFKEWSKRRWDYDLLDIYPFVLIYNETTKQKEYYDLQTPKWLGDEKLHESYRAMLYWKDTEYYKQFKWDYINLIGRENTNVCNPPKPEYYWPVTKNGA